MKKVIALFFALSMVFTLCACGSDWGSSKQQNYADQDEFLSSMAKGISDRLKHVDDEKERTAEEEAAYLAGLVDRELKEIGKYDTLVFEDELFNELAHAYINGCKTQLLSITHYKNSNLYPSLWEAGSKARNAIIVEMYSRYDLPITGEEAAHYSVGEITYSIVTDNNTGKEEPPLYNLGTIATKTCERGEAKLSLDEVEIKGTQVFLTATNHGDIGFPSGSGGGIRVTYYDSDGYNLGGSYANLPEPWKPDVTITFNPLDFSYMKYADEIEFFLVEYYVFSESGSGILDTSVKFNYACDRSGKQIDPDTLIS